MHDAPTGAAYVGLPYGADRGLTEPQLSAVERSTNLTDLRCVATFVRTNED
jgi:hypothetical protein